MSGICCSCTCRAPDFELWTSMGCFPTYWDCRSAMILEILCSDVSDQSIELMNEVGPVFRPDTKWYCMIFKVVQGTSYYG